MSSYILPVLIILLILYSSIKKNNTYSSFVSGASSSFDVVMTSFPYIVVIFIAVEIFNVSGLDVIFEDFINRNICSDIKSYEYKNIYFVSNVPYYITTPILMKLMDSNINFSKIRLSSIVFSNYNLESSTIKIR